MRKVSEFELSLILASWVRNNDKAKIKLWNKLNKLDIHNHLSTASKLEQIENLIQSRKMK